MIVGREPETHHPAIGHAFGRRHLEPEILLVVVGAGLVELTEVRRQRAFVHVVVRHVIGANSWRDAAEDSGLREVSPGDARIVQPVEAGVAPPRQVGRDAEVPEQLVLDAEQELVRQRRAVVADLVRVAAKRIVRIEAGDALEVRELVDVRYAVAVQIDGRIVDVRVVRDGRHCDRRAARIELRSERGVAAAHNRLA